LGRARGRIWERKCFWAGAIKMGAKKKRFVKGEEAPCRRKLTSLRNRKEEANRRGGGHHQTGEVGEGKPRIRFPLREAPGEGKDKIPKKGKGVKGTIPSSVLLGNGVVPGHLFLIIPFASAYRPRAAKELEGRVQGGSRQRGSRYRGKKAQGVLRRKKRENLETTKVRREGAILWGNYLLSRPKRVNKEKKKGPDSGGAEKRGGCIKDPPIAASAFSFPKPTKKKLKSRGVGIPY